MPSLDSCVVKFGKNISPNDIEQIKSLGGDLAAAREYLYQLASSRPVGRISAQGYEPTPVAREIALKYMIDNGLPIPTNEQFATINKAFGETIAREFTLMKHQPNDPEVKAAYAAMITETMAQYDAMLTSGIVIEFITGEDPYASPKEAVLDVQENNHMWVYSTRDGFGSDDNVDVSDNPLLAETSYEISGQTALANDIFRVVHDYFGHVKNGVGFRARGEENAWQSHASMYSPLALRAMTTETRGQNSWVNFGPNAEANQTASAADTVYADQKIGLLPVWVSQEGNVNDRREIPTEARQSDGERLSPPITDGRIELTHNSRTTGIARLDPEFYGSNFAGAEKQRANHKDWLDRTYYGIAQGDAGGYVKETRTGSVKYNTSVDARLLYDLSTDVDELNDGNITTYERAIRDAGYVGYWRKHPTLGLVAAVFDPLEVESPPTSVLYQAQRNSIGLYSGLATAIETLRMPEWKKPEGTVTGAQLIQKLQPGKTEGVKAEEVEWTGLVEFLQAGDKFTRGQVVEFVNANGVQVEEVVADQETTGNIEWDEEVMDDESMYGGDVEYYVDSAEDWFDYGDWLENNVEEFLAEVADPTIHDEIRNLIDIDQLNEIAPLMESNGLSYKGTLQVAAETDMANRAQDQARDSYMDNPVTLTSTTTNDGLLIEISGNDDFGYELKIGNEPIGNYSTLDDAIEVVSDRGLLNTTTGTKFGDNGYNMSGRYTNYREIKLTLPGLTGDAFVYDAHFEDPNIVAFLRVDDRKRTSSDNPPVADWMVAGDTIPDEMYFSQLKMSWGEYKESPAVDSARVAQSERNWTTMPMEGRKSVYKTSPAVALTQYFIEELQSDWHQQGRQKGYQDDPIIDIGALKRERDDLLDKRRLLIIDREDAAMKALGTIPGMVEGEPLFFDGQQLTAAKWRAMMEGMFDNSQLDFQRPEMAKYVSEKMREFDLPELHKGVMAVDAEARAITAKIEGRANVVPDAPFKGDAWLALGLKRALVDAIDRGADQLAWSDAEVLVERWSDTYRQLYMTQYNDKMPSITKKLTGQQPRHLDLAGEPVGVELKMLRNDKQIEAQLAETGEVFARNYAVYEDGSRDQGSTSAPVRIDSMYFLEQFREAGTIGVGRIEVFSHNPMMQEEGVWVIDITPELRAKVEVTSTLFQETRGQIELLDDQRIIRLGKASDLSTFLHESAHLFLEMEKVFAAKYGATDDHTTLLNWLGLASMAEIDASTPEGVEAHETFARGFEAYLREGKAPSSALRQAFSAFKSWLTQIYRQISQLDVEINDEVRGVFDRLLATESEIMAASGSSAYDQYFQSKEQSGMSDADWALYQKRAKARISRATDDVDKVVLDELRKRMSAQWKLDRAPLIEEEEERLANTPVYQIMGDLTVMPFDYDSVLEALGVTKLPGRLIGKARKVDGVDPQEYAEAYGYDTVKEMLTDIVNAQPLKKAATEAAQTRMIEMNGDILNDGTIELEAREALHNDEQAAMLLQEINALRPQGAAKVDRDYLKYKAKEMISGMYFAEIQPNKYYRMEIKAAQRGVGAVGAEAFDAKVQQLANHYLYREAVDTKRDMQKHRKYVKAAQTRKYDEKAVDQAYIANIKLLANLYDLRSPQAQQADIEKILNWYSSTLEAADDTGVEVMLMDPNLVLALLARKRGEMHKFQLPKFDSLTAEDLRGVYDMLRHLRFVGGQLGDVQTNEIMMERHQLNESIDAEGRKDVQDAERPGRPESKWQSVPRLMNLLPSLKNLVRTLDGFSETNTTANDALFRPIEDATNRRTALHNDMFTLFEELLGDIHKVGLSRYTEETFVVADGRTLKFNAENLFMMALNWGTATSRDAIRDGYGITDGDVNTMLATLTPAQLAMVNATWKVNESMWPQLASASMTRYGVVPAKLDAVPFTVNGVEMTGGHMRLFYKSYKVEVKGEQQAASTRANLMPNKAGSLHERVGSDDMEVLLDRSNIVTAIEENLHFIAFAETSNHIRRLVNAKDIQATIMKKHGPAFHGALMAQLNNLLTNRRSPAGNEFEKWLSPAFRLFRQAATMRHLVGSLRNVMQQVTALPIAMADVGAIPMFNAIALYATDHVAVTDMIESKSVFMRNRTSFVNREAADHLNKLSVNGEVAYMWNNLMAMGFVPQTYIDKVIAIPTWLAAYEKALNQHGDESRAVSDADTLVAESVGSGADIHMGAAFNSNNSELVRTFTLFGSFFNAYYQRMYRDTKGGRLAEGSTFRPEWITSPQALHTLITVPIIVAAMSAALVMDLPEDEESYPEWILKRYASFLSGTIPIVRDVFSFGFSGFSPKTVFAGAQEGPVRTAQEISAFLKEDQSGLKTSSDILKVVSTFVPVPGAGQVTRAADYVDSYNQGKEGKFNAYQMLVEGPNRNK